jgi:hypothetical protein
MDISKRQQYKYYMMPSALPSDKLNVFDSNVQASTRFDAVKFLKI